MQSAPLGLAALLHPRDEIEVMFGVQALSAYHAATSTSGQIIPTRANRRADTSHPPPALIYAAPASPVRVRRISPKETVW